MSKTPVILLLLLLSAERLFAQKANTASMVAAFAKQSSFKSQEDKASALIKLYGELLKEADPLTATLSGFKGYEGKWPDLSLQHRSVARNNYQTIAAILTTINRETLGQATKVDLSLIQEDAINRAKAIDLGTDLMPIDQMNGVHITIPNILPSLPLNTIADLDNFISLLSTVDTCISQATTLLKEGAKLRVVQAKIAVAPVPGQIKSVLTQNAGDSPFYEPLKSLNALPESAQQLYREKAKGIISGRINPAYRKLLDYIEKEYYPQCRDVASISSLKGGREMYNFMIRVQTSSNLDAERIHQLGLAEVKRIEEEMAVLRQRIGFKGTVKEFDNLLQTDPKFYFTSATELLSAYRNICKMIDPELARFFGKLPRLPYGVKGLPDFSAPSSPTAYYYSGSAALGTPGYFYANTYKLNTRPKWEMEALTLHESVPGHHLQLALADEQKVEDFRKFMFYNSFSEGWGLYSESLGGELGLYTDLYSKYGQLTYELWRAIRLVVDTGIHYFGWNRDYAILYFTQNSAKQANDIAVEVDRYIAWPGQALGYKIGELKIKELRKAAQTRLGSKFDIRGFHDVVLGNGNVPLTVLESNVNTWIGAQAK